MHQHSDRRLRPLHLALATLFGLAALGAARADDQRGLPRPVPPAYTVECGACHTAYPPGMLPARSWQRVMGSLDRHYGADASLDAPIVREIERWLLAHAGTSRRVRTEPPEDRLTRSAWFERKHRAIDASVWKLASVKSAANCGACHSGADRGDFDDDNLKVPEGLDRRLRRPWHD